jgi:hypothetical protein
MAWRRELAGLPESADVIAARTLVRPPYSAAKNY